MRYLLRSWTFAVCLLALELQGPTRAADDKPAERPDLDERVCKALHEVISQGADLYNGGNRGACYHLFAGSLMTLEPLLDHRPNLQQAIRKGLGDAKRQTTDAARAWALRFVMDDLGVALTPQAAARPQTLWERLGGEENMKKVVDDLVKAATTDPKVNFSRGGKYPLAPERLNDFKNGLLDLASSVSDGPRKYKKGTMEKIHKGMQISDAEFDAFTGHLKKALADHGVNPPDAAFLLKAVAETRKTIVEAKDDAPKKLWERLGGEANLKKVIDDLVQAVIDDPNVNFFRGRKNHFTPEQKENFKTQLLKLASNVSDGPLPKYSGKTMQEIHKGMGITDAEFAAFITQLEKALAEHGVKPGDAAELVQLVNSTRKSIVEK
jgi:hemoglobin